MKEKIWKIKTNNENDYVLDMNYVNACCLNAFKLFADLICCGRLLNIIERLQRKLFGGGFRNCVSEYVS